MAANEVRDALDDVLVLLNEELRPENRGKAIHGAELTLFLARDELVARAP